jgi:malonate transporter
MQLAIAFNTIFPIFAMIAIGFACARWEILPAATGKVLNILVMKLALPALIFRGMARISFAELGQGGFFVSYAIGLAVVFGLGWLISYRLHEPPADRAIAALTTGCANVGFMGFPLCLSVLGEQSLPAVVISNLQVAVLLFGLTIVLIELDVSHGGGRRAALRKACINLGRNPITMAPVLAIVFPLSGIGLPPSADGLFALLGSAASPCALLGIGFFLAECRSLKVSRTVQQLTAVKLLVQPAVTYVFAFQLLNVPSDWAKAALLLSALPSGTGPFILGAYYERDVLRTSQTVLFSTLCSIVTLSLLISFVKM